MSDDDIPYTEIVVLDFDCNRMKCMFFNEEWIIEKVMLKNFDKIYFSIFLEKIAPTTVPFTMVSSASVIGQPVVQVNYFDKNFTRCKVFSCEESLVKDDKIRYPDRRVSISLYPKDENLLNVPSSNKNKLSKSMDSSEEQVHNWNEIGFKNLSCDLAMLLEDCKLSDVTLSAGGKSIGAHKCILSARSKVFKAMFQHGMSESENNAVEIKDVDFAVLKIFMQFMYTGKFPDVTTDIASDLYMVADKYAVGELKMKCAAYLCSNLSVENVLAVICLADLFSDETIKKAGFDFIFENRELLISDQFHTFRSDYPKLACDVYAFYVENVKHAYNQSRVLPRMPLWLAKDSKHLCNCYNQKNSNFNLKDAYTVRGPSL